MRSPVTAAFLAVERDPVVGNKKAEDCSSASPRPVPGLSAMYHQHHKRPTVKPEGSATTKSTDEVSSSYDFLTD
jgi:hypothetical protein